MPSKPTTERMTHRQVSTTFRAPVRRHRVVGRLDESSRRGSRLEVRLLGGRRAVVRGLLFVSIVAEMRPGARASDCARTRETCLGFANACARNGAQAMRNLLSRRAPPGRRARRGGVRSSPPVRCRALPWGLLSPILAPAGRAVMSRDRLGPNVAAGQKLCSLSRGRVEDAVFSLGN